MMTSIDIQAAENELQAAVYEVYKRGEAVIAAKVALEDAKARAYLDGAIVGKNAERREASEAVLLQDQIGALRIAEAGKRYADFLLRETEIAWEALNMRLNLYELTSTAMRWSESFETYPDEVRNDHE